MLSKKSKLFYLFCIVYQTFLPNYYLKHPKGLEYKWNQVKTSLNMSYQLIVLSAWFKKSSVGPRTLLSGSLKHWEVCLAPEEDIPSSEEVNQNMLSAFKCKDHFLQGTKSNVITFSSLQVPPLSPQHEFFWSEDVLFAKKDCIVFDSSRQQAVTSWMFGRLKVPRTKERRIQKGTLVSTLTLFVMGTGLHLFSLTHWHCVQ